MDFIFDTPFEQNMSNNSLTSHSSVDESVLEPHGENINDFDHFLKEKLPQARNFDINTLFFPELYEFQPSNTENASFDFTFEDENTFPFNFTSLNNSQNLTNIKQNYKSKPNKKNIHEPEDNYIKAYIYQWHNEDLELLGGYHYLNLKVDNLDARKVSHTVYKTVLKELELEDSYLSKKSLKSHKKKERVRRNPYNFELCWTPVSLYQAAYTNIKIHHLYKTNFLNETPKDSCFGKVNMRVKRAWTRGPNRNSI